MTYPRDCLRLGESQPYEIYWCDACNFGQLHPRPSQAEVDEFYENYYTHKPVEVRATASVKRNVLERLRERLAWSLDGGSDMDAEFIHHLVHGQASSICDLGCGDGRLLAGLRARGHRVAGVEPDPVTLQLAVARGIDVYRGHADNLPVPVASSKFDIVIMCHVLHLCPEPVRVIHNARKLLRRGGLLVCETTNNEALGLRQSGACWRWLDMPRHLDLFTAASLQRIVVNAGLHVKRVEFAGYTRQFKRAWLEDEARKCAILYPLKRYSANRQLLQNWILLARTALARPERKYDSVRVIAAVGETPA